MYPGLFARRQKMVQAMGVGIPRQQKALKKQKASGPDPRVPPNQGRMYLPIIGCTRNNRNAPQKTVRAYKAIGGLADEAESESAITGIDLMNQPAAILFAITGIIKLHRIKVIQQQLPVRCVKLPPPLPH